MLAAIFFAASVVLSILAHFYTRFPGDLWLALRIQSIDGTVFERLMQGTTWLFGGWGASAIVILSVAIVLISIGWRQAVVSALAGLSTWSSSLLKAIIGRPRPSAELVRVLDVQSNKSFPSGHALFVTVMLGFLIYLCLTYMRRGMLRTTCLTILALLILLTGISRVYLGAHWPSDVLGGYIIGGLLLSTLILLERGISSRTPRPES
jgi:membrane-associated phospholipid phosphatase